jgi:hypothetical protein
LPLKLFDAGISLTQLPLEFRDASVAPLHILHVTSGLVDVETRATNPSHVSEDYFLGCHHYYPRRKREAT